MKTILSALLALAVLLSAGGCQKQQPTEALNTLPLNVVVHYRERIMLPPDCTLTVTLENVSRLDAKAEVITSVTQTIQAAPPFKVTLRYDPLQIHDRLSYALRARIEFDGQLLFTNTERIDPFAEDQTDPIEILVRQTRK